MAGTLAAGAQFGRYAIVRLIGSGGMGSVYEAMHVDLKKPVALKIIHASLAVDPAIQARFLREGVAASRIRHPHVVDVTDFGLHEGVPFLVMELLEGESLAARIARDGALPVEEVADLMVPVCAAIAATHDEGVIHRDLKPENVFLARSRDGHVAPKVVDFGVCKLGDADAPQALQTGSALIGSPGYLSPEQIAAGEITARIDQYALGVVLYECLTGRAAFTGEGLFQIMGKIVEGDCPRPRALRPELPEAVETVILRAMHKDASARFESVHVLGAALLRFAGNRTRTLWSAAFATAAHPAIATLPAARDAADAAAPSPATAPVPVWTVRHSLPAERDPFVGRDADLLELGRRLRDGARLVSVVGIGGTGKTRLVVRHGWATLAAWPGGVWFCDLAESRSVDGIAYAVARALAVPLGKAPIAQLGDVLAAYGRCLVILDNFEQVARHAEATLGAWLDRAHEAQFVVTTREVLGLASEVVIALSPLGPDDALALFLRRAEAAKRGFQPSEAELVAIATLVKLLDRLPLAIELAATRVRLMPPVTLLARMGKRFDVLTSRGGRHDRQATLRATLDWSWDLLSPAEQAALAQLSVFEGDFTLEAVEAVVDVPGAWPGDLLQGLLDKSLVRQVAEARFDLLVSVAEYATERLATLGGRDAAELRHGVHYGGLGRPEAIDALDTHGGGERLAALAREIDNLAAACLRAVARGDGATATATLVAVGEVLERRGPVTLAIELARQVLSVATLTARQRGRGAFVLGVALRLHGAEAEARSYVEAALAIARAEADRSSECRIGCYLARALANEGALESARVHAEAALAIARDRGDRRQEGVAIGVIAIAAAERGHPDDARRYLGEAIAIDREVGNRRLEALHLSNLGYHEMTQGRLAQARHHLETSLALQRDVGDRSVAGGTSTYLALVILRQGELDVARRHLEAASTLARAVGNRKAEGMTLATLGELELRAGRLDEARDALTRGEATIRAIGHRILLAQLLCLRSEYEHRIGQAAAARAALDEAEAIGRALGVAPATELGGLLAQARALVAPSP